MSFVKSLAIGEKAQIGFAKVLLDTKKIVSMEFAQGRFSDWDIKIKTPEGETTYEVKTDTQAQDTGCFAVEYRYKGKASGIFASKADYIVYYIAGEWWVAERSELVLTLPTAPKERETQGGDGYYSSLRIISCEQLPNLFTKIEINDKQKKADGDDGTGGQSNN